MKNMVPFRLAIKKLDVSCIELNFVFGGADEDRTRYLIVANDALSQMSYGPKAIVKVYQNGKYLQEL